MCATREAVGAANKHTISKLCNLFQSGRKRVFNIRSVKSHTFIGRTVLAIILAIPLHAVLFRECVNIKHFKFKM